MRTARELDASAKQKKQDFLRSPSRPLPPRGRASRSLRLFFCVEKSTGCGQSMKTMAALSSETQGQLVGQNKGINRDEIVKTIVFKNGGKRPWAMSLSRPRLCQCWLLVGRKNHLYYSAQSASSNLE